jgi:tRNA(Ile)-lysidine synthase TilS/MesJ
MRVPVYCVCIGSNLFCYVTQWRHQSRQGKPLGRHERRWLSHYDNFQHPTTPQVALLEVGGDLKSTLDTAMSTADGLLVEASKDRNSIAKALKMNEAGLDDSMEHLRWYIYQKECAIWINEGLTIPPETESLEILGCLRPSLFGQNDAEDSAVVSDSSTTSPDNRKRKFDPAQGPSKSDTVSIDPVVFVFRDGEHMGEASLEEIEAGFDDGELSEECAIFDRESDSWVSVKEFLKDSYIATSPKEDLSAATDDQARLETVHLMQEVNKDDEIMREAVKELKKPSRDSSAWGQTTAPLLPRTAGPEAPIPTIMAQASKKGKKGGGFKPPAKMMRCITKAVFEWNMIEDGDRLLLGLSGGKDSLSLLHCLLEFKKKFPIKFDIEVCTIDPLTPSFDPSPLIPYVESLGLKYHYIRDDIVDRASKSGKGGKVVSSLCAYCARMKRGNLYTCARRNNCNKLVLAQHLDDLAESFLMSTFHNGFLRTMKAHYRINEGDLSVIRPMVYCRESLMTEFAKVASLPVINENCPACFEEPKERARVKKLLSREETLYPDLLDNIRRALIPLMHDDSTAILRSYLDETVERSKKENHLKWKKRAESKAKNDTTESVLVAVPREEPGVDHDSKRARLMLSEASEDDLVRELAKRRAEKFRLAGAMKRLEKDEEDPTDQVCTLSGGNGSIPCRELME